MYKYIPLNTDYNQGEGASKNCHWLYDGCIKMHTLIEWFFLIVVLLIHLSKMLELPIMKQPTLPNGKYPM